MVAVSTQHEETLIWVIQYLPQSQNRACRCRTIRLSPILSQDEYQFRLVDGGKVAVSDELACVRAQSTTMQYLGRIKVLCASVFQCLPLSSDVACGR